MPGANLSGPTPDLPMYAAGYGLMTPYGVWLPPGGRVASFVRSGGAEGYDDPFLTANLVSTLNAGLARCRSGKGDTVIVLPGHAENISTADFMSSLVAGTNIVCCGSGNLQPTFTWTATASTWLFDVANVTLTGAKLVWNGIDDVVSAIPVTAAGCTIANCHITVESASAGALLGVTVGAGASRFKLSGNTVVSVGEAHPLTSAVVLVSSAVDDVLIADNYISAANPGTNVLGLIAVTAAATNVRILRNTLIQLETAGTSLFGITVGNVAATGVMAYNNVHVGTDLVITTAGVTVGAAGLVGFAMYENRVSDATNTQGALIPVVSA